MEARQVVYSDELATIDNSRIKKQPKLSIPGLRFSKSAQLVFNTWRESLENRLRSGESDTPAFESHLSKYRSLVPSLALIFHLCEFPTLDSIEVGEKSLEKSLQWSRTLESHARKIYSHILHCELQSAHTLAKKIQSRSVESGMTVRAIYRKGWSHLESSSQVDRALAVLEDCGWLRVDQVKGATKPREEITLNPQLKIND